jgi:hypothetical protein
MENTEASRPKTTTEKLYFLYYENKRSHSKGYVEELLAQIELFATESNTASREWIREELGKVIGKSQAIDDKSNATD